MSQPWTIEPFSNIDKMVTINGPHEMRIYVDHDDVNTTIIDQMIEAMVADLNREKPRAHGQWVTAEQHWKDAVKYPDYLECGCEIIDGQRVAECESPECEFDESKVPSSPIRPADVPDKKLKEMPNLVIDVFNEFITRKFNGRSARVIQDEVVEVLVEKGLNRKEMFDNHWLDIEDLFRSKGWTVKYDKPGYNEEYDAYFVFEVGK